MTTSTTIGELAQRIRRKEISPVEITRDCLERIEKQNPALNAFITVMAESAVAEARTAEAEILRGEWRGPLHGIPVALKDLIDTAGVRTTSASALHKDRVPNQDAEVVRRLRQAGAVIIGKNNLHEFAYGGVRWSVTSATFIIRGTSARIAGGIVGRIGGGGRRRSRLTLRSEPTRRDRFANRRRCAAVWGLKPTYGRVSGRGVIPLSRRWIMSGRWRPLWRMLPIVLQAIAGYDAADMRRPMFPPRIMLRPCARERRRLRVGVPRGYFFDDLDPEVARRWSSASARDCETLGAK